MADTNMNLDIKNSITTISLSLMAAGICLFFFGDNIAVSFSLSWQTLTRIYVFSVAITSVGVSMLGYKFKPKAGYIIAVTLLLLYSIFYSKGLEFLSFAAMHKVNASELLIHNGGRLL